MPTTIEEFDTVRITEFAVKFKDEEKAQPFGCVGTIEGESEIVAIIKRCEGVEKKRKPKVSKMTITISAHVRLAAQRRIFGISADGLKPGVYKYGADSIGDTFVLTAVGIDEFEDEEKLIAFSNCSANTGLTLSIENGAEEVAEIELEFTALVDDKRGIYYETYISELADEGKEEFITNWKTNFTPELVLAIPAETPEAPVETP
ncbi:phage tail protein [Lysinibacillus capsici]|uniref:phage tail protein n=1 Tax=Lysinibacillus capsici TaxID=2115968 RepID=UPI002E204457|nr:phage tail protein [Lysinibacillus capsici]